MQSDRILVERLNVACKADAVHEKHRHEHALLAQRVQEFILQYLTLIAHNPIAHDGHRAGAARSKTAIVPQHVRPLCLEAVKDHVDKPSAFIAARTEGSSAILFM